MAMLRARAGSFLFGVFAVALSACSTTEATPGVDASTDGGGITPGCGRLSTLCENGGPCEGAPDCASGICRDNVCGTRAPADGIKNGDETDVDCGGSSAPACADGKGCNLGADCVSGSCASNVCQAPNDHDGVKNGDETGVDCGGPTTAKKCAQGQGCQSDADCNNLKCDLAAHTCASPSASDGFKNGDETDVDCGGSGPTRCPTGKACLVTADCDKVLCDTAGTKLCLEPASDDNIKNGTETDIDCGGGAPTNANKCAAGLGCGVHADCLSDGCAYNNKCAITPSCATQFGGDTCGAGEVGQGGAVHESCCKQLSVPGRSIKVDKYEITAGRMREFIKRVGGDVQGWVTDHRSITQQIPDDLVQYLPIDNETPVLSINRCLANGTGCAPTNTRFGIYGHLGNEVFMPDRPCNNCGQGCWYNTGMGENGHPTYYWDDDTQAMKFGAGPRVNTQSELDAKSLNCVTQVLLAAFCAWDGGRLPTQAELGGTSGVNDSVWGPSGMPWGGAATSFKDTVNGAGDAGRIVYPFAATSPCSGGTCFTVPMLTVGGGYNPQAAVLNWTNFNPFPSSPGVFSARYVFPVPGNTATNDQAYAVASPGRMRKDFRPVGPGGDDGFYDVAANVIEMTATTAGVDNANHNSWPRVEWVGGSFEGHDPNNRGGFDLNVFTKYGKAGGRCARD